MSKLKRKPTFKTDTQEAAFWASHDSSLLDQLKTLANKRAVPYQTLLKLFVLERVQAELHLKTAKVS